MRKTVRGLAAAAVLFVFGSPAGAVDVPVPVKIGLVKPGILAKFVAKPVTSFPLPSSAPTSVGATLDYFDTSSSANTDTYNLPSGGWTGLGNPAGSKGYKYKGTGLAGDPCKVVLIKTTVIKAVCKGPDIQLIPPFIDPPTGGEAGVILTVGGDRYCGELGGTAIKNQTGLFKRKDAPAPGTCPTIPTGCCPAGQMITNSGPGTLTVGQLPAFPFPLGVLTTINVGAADAFCKHDARVPMGGFAVPVFCIPALGFTSDVFMLGCDSGTEGGKGFVWDAGAPLVGPNCPTTNILKQGDTRDGVCDPTTTACLTTTGPANTLGNITQTNPGGCASPAGVHTLLDIPATSVTWSDGDSTFECPDEDGVYDPGSDLLVSTFTFVLSPTTGISTAAFVDTNADGCRREGAGPGGPVTLTGASAPGPCCSVGQTTTVVSVGAAFSGGGPLYDLLFRSSVPATVSACNAPAALGTCNLTDPCRQ
jgi:hypothetical protein